MKVRLLAVSFVLGWLVGYVGVAKPQAKAVLFSLPQVGTKTVWEAEQAIKVTPRDWEVRKDGKASGGAYVRPLRIGKDVMLEFPISVPNETSIMVYPLWWKHGERLPARRFPFPLELKPGPDVIVSAEKNLALFTAPASGRIGIFDIVAKRPIGAINVGGYISDLVSDLKSGKFYASDAVNDRVLIGSLRELRVVGEIKTPQAPWALAFSDGVLYCVAREGKSVIAVDSRNDKVVAERELGWSPIGVDATDKEVFVWFKSLAINLADMSQVEPHFDVDLLSRREFIEVGRPGTVGARRYSRKPGAIIIEAWTDKGYEQKEVDVKQVTGAQSIIKEVPSPLVNTSGPDVMCLVGNRLFFTSPVTGKVGVVDVVKGTLEGAVDIGGYVSDILADAPRNRVFVADATNNRIVAIDAKDLKAVASLKVDKMPIMLEAFIPPGFLRSCPSLLFVACYEGESVAVIDLPSLEIRSTIKTPFKPYHLRVVNPPDPGWWPLIPVDRIPLVALRAYLFITPAPIALSKDELKHLRTLVPAPTYRRRVSLTQEVVKGVERVITVENNHTVRISLRDAQGRWLSNEWFDVSDITDVQLLPDDLPLTARDKPGTITIALDGGSEFNWQRGIWQTPTQGIFLINDTDEFWAWNAPKFKLPPGRHVIRVRAYSRYALIDGLQVRRTLHGMVRMNVYGHSELPIEQRRYQSVFYADEPVELHIELTNLTRRTQRLNLSFTISDYMDKEVTSGNRLVELEPNGKKVEVIRPELKQTGIFSLFVRVSSSDGDLFERHYFMRLPQLTRPRMLLRKEHIPEVEKRMQGYARLFERYFQWLRRQCDREGFLPAGITKATFVPKLPEAQQKLNEKGGWRRYELGWRMVATGFAALFAREPNLRSFFMERVSELLKDGRADTYCTFHHHGPFFPGAVAILFDFAVASLGDTPEVQRLREFFRGYIGNMDVFPWTLAALDEPISVRERAILWHIMSWLVNAERYFNTHAGTRGGTRWLNPRTGCHCPYAGYAYPFLYLRHFLDEPQFHERVIVRGFITYCELIHPRMDNRRMLGVVNPLGEPIRQIDNAISKHPLGAFKYDWSKLIEKLMAEDTTDEEVDKLLYFAEEAASNRPMAFVVPIQLALGWYDPKTPSVKFEELPPTVLFDGEGEVVMRSDWSNDLTEVWFACGVRDHVYRHQPTHLQIAKAGEFLLGTLSSYGDDGNPNPGKSWGNVVVIEPSDWLERWGNNLSHPRAEELPIIMRFSDATFRYIARDRLLVGYAPAEGGYGGGLDLHGHTESVFLREGELLAYETHPEFDYVCGDATNSWLPSQAEEVYRQVVFIRPNVILVYDRVRLGDEAKRAFWVGAVGEKVELQEGMFKVRQGNSAMNAYVLMPTKAQIQVYDLSQPNKYTTPPPFSINWRLADKVTAHQKVIEIHPEGVGRQVEFLILMSVGVGSAEEVSPKLSINSSECAVEFAYNGKRYRVSFARDGVPAGEMTISNGKQTIKHRFVQSVDDSYRHWSTDKRFKMWMTDKRFEFIIPERDRKAFAK
jgi:DNA-binding beta-propeller fold protein YncE